MKELLIVSVGSFFGGGVRYLVSKGIGMVAGTGFPLPTMMVNIAGCFLIGLISGLASTQSISPSIKLLLTTGFCGGFTTFSTFMNENLMLARGGQIAWALGYTILSLALGLIALVAGYKVANA